MKWKTCSFASLRGFLQKLRIFSFSPIADLDPSSVNFETHNVSHLPVAISVRLPKAVAKTETAPLLRNNSISILGDQFEFAIIELSPMPAEESTARFAKLRTEYKP